jgi:putative chitinase
MMSLQALQQKIGATPDGEFGPVTFRLARDYFKLTTEQAAHFFAQCAHESGDFKWFTENMNYTASGLMKVFPRYFPTMSVALAYAGDGEAIASRAYASRMGNGPASSGDGWKFQGRGAIQLTGRATYQAFADSGYPGFMEHPELVATQYAFESAKWFFDANKIWPLAKVVTDQSIESVRRKVNGGTNGLPDCVHKTKRYAQWK